MVIVTVVNDIDVGDGGCVGIISGYVAALAGTGGLVTRAVVAGVSLQVCGAVLQVLGSSVDVPASFSRCSGSLLGAVWITALALDTGFVCVAVDCHCLSSSICVTVLWVLAFFGIPLAFTPCIILSNPSFATKYPSLRPKPIPRSIPSFNPNFFPCIIPNFSPSSIARTHSSLRFSPLLVVAAQLQN